MTPHAWMLGAAALAGIAGCTDTPAGAGSAGTATPSHAAARGRVTVAGQLVDVANRRLTVRSGTGDVTVTLLSRTRLARDVRAAVDDLVVGVCVAASGPSDGTTIHASVLVIEAATASGCGTGTRVTPSPGSGAPRPTATPAANGFAGGLLTAVNGQSLTVAGSAGSQAVVLGDHPRITRLSPATASDLQPGQCVFATGQRSTGGVVQATAVTIVPAADTGGCPTPPPPSPAVPSPTG